MKIYLQLGSGQKLDKSQNQKSDGAYTGKLSKCIL